ncbi:MAG: tRNA nucleotidyltransferase, partial [Mangrovimonas sp.]|nr:tRNA nucleotidyltransferase [Mangrovimonas sp.]
MNYKKALQHNIFNIISQSAKELAVDSYVIGGYVRDYILNRGEHKDIDVVAIGSGIELATQVAKNLPNHPKVQIFKTYGTAMLRHEEMEVEFVGA